MSIELIQKKILSFVPKADHAEWHFYLVKSLYGLINFKAAWNGSKKKVCPKADFKKPKNQS